MDNRIRSFCILDRRPDPAEAELAVHVVPERMTPTTELRGRLLGPRCRYSTTVEIAYPLRPFPGTPPAVDALEMRIIIPEPSFWDPESPFLYEGPIELWQDRRRCDRVQGCHGIRRTLLGPHGLRWNGKSLMLQGRRVRSATEDEMHAWRRQGVNLLLVPVTEETAPLWDLADRIGMIVLGEVSSIDGPTLPRLQSLEAHPSCLGWLLGPTALPREGVGRTNLGVRLDNPPQGPLPASVRFVACPAERAEAFAALGLPLLLLGGAPANVAAVMGCVA